MHGGGYRPSSTLLWGFSLTQVFVALAVLVLVASVFVPASQIQCAAAKRAMEEEQAIEMTYWTSDWQFTP
jgi:hypothetical protein